MDRWRRGVRATHRARRLRAAAGIGPSHRPADPGPSLRAVPALGILGPAMTHVFVAPHPDDVALSCGGLIASLRELGQTVTILTVFSGDGTGQAAPHGLPARGARLRLESACGRSPRPSTAAISQPTGRRRARSRRGPRRGPARSDPGRRRRGGQAVLAALLVVPPGEHPQRVAGRPGRDGRRSTQGALYTDDLMDAAAAGELMARRRIEDERFAYFAEASIVFLDLPDAVFRGYEGDDELLGDAARRRRCAVRAPPPGDRPARAAAGLPAARGRWSRRPPALSRGRCPTAREGRRWVMPGPDYAGLVVFYEDFPYAWWNDFRRPRRPAGRTVRRPARGRQRDPRVRRHDRPARAEDHAASASTRASSSACSTARARWPTRSAPRPRDGEMGGSLAPPSGTGSPAASDPGRQSSACRGVLAWRSSHFRSRSLPGSSSA